MSAKHKTIFRVQKNPNNPFVMIDKRPLYNKSLSLKAKGLLSIMLTCPNEWTFNFSWVVKQSNDGKAATRTAMKELINAGHVVMTQSVSEKNLYQKVTYHVYEISRSVKEREEHQPLTENREAGKREAENRHISNTDSNKNDSSNIKNIAGEETPAPLPKKEKRKSKKVAKPPWEWEGADFEEYGIAYEKLIGRRPISASEQVFWVNGNGRTMPPKFGFRHYDKAGITVQDMAEGYRQHTSNGGDVSSPSSVFYKADRIRRARSASSQDVSGHGKSLAERQAEAAKKAESAESLV